MQSREREIQTELIARQAAKPLNLFKFAMLTMLGVFFITVAIDPGSTGFGSSAFQKEIAFGFGFLAYLDGVLLGSMFGEWVTDAKFQAKEMLENNNTAQSV